MKTPRSTCGAADPRQSPRYPAGAGEEASQGQSKEATSTCDNGRSGGTHESKPFSPQNKYFPLKKSGTTKEALKKEQLSEFQKQQLQHRTRNHDGTAQGTSAAEASNLTRQQQ